MEEKVSTKENLAGLEIGLRPCKPEDIGFVYELMYHGLGHFFDRFTSEKWSREKFRRGFDPARITIIEHDGMPIGFFDVDYSEREAKFRNLHLSDDYHGRSIGSWILRFIEKQAAERKIRRITGKVFSSRSEAIRFLNRGGYKIVKYLPEEGSYLIKKDLNKK
jgi:GNAT superfamily N-acetyltransferase